MGVKGDMNKWGLGLAIRKALHEKILLCLLRLKSAYVQRPSSSIMISSMDAKYSELSGSEPSCEGERLMDEHAHPNINHSRSRKHNLCWISLLVVSFSLNGFFAMFIITYWQAWSAPSLSGQEKILGYDTELYEARKIIQEVHVQFDGGFIFVPNMGGTSLHFSGSKRFFGTPSPEMDQAWGQLLAEEYLGLNESEAVGAEHSMYSTNPDGSKLYSIALDVYHQLHCLNEARKYIDMDYYADSTWSEAFKKVNRLHLDHCLNYLRQTIMCHSDLTPITVHWDHVTKRPQPDFEKVHACRNFEKVQDWAAGRRRRIDNHTPLTT